jgi:hypothetical protein
VLPGEHDCQLGELAGHVRISATQRGHGGTEANQHAGDTRRSQLDGSQLDGSRLDGSQATLDQLLREREMLLAEHAHIVAERRCLGELSEAQSQTIARNAEQCVSWSRTRGPASTEVELEAPRQLKLNRRPRVSWSQNRRPRVSWSQNRRPRVSWSQTRRPLGRYGSGIYDPWV